MAYQTGTATDHADFYSKLIDFLTTDSELVGTGQAWEVVWESPSDGENETDIVLKGPGLADTDSIYVGLRREDNVLNDSSQILIYGMTGIVTSATTVDAHINVVTAPVRVFLKTTPMDYWITASGRRWLGAVQVGTVYESFYAGFFLPYGNPLQYNYPLYIGGTAGSGDGAGEPVDWRSQDPGHSAFPYSDYEPQSGSNRHNPSAWMLDPAGSWLACGVLPDGASNNPAQAPDVWQGPTSFGYGNGLGADISPTTTPGKLGFFDVMKRLGTTFGAGFTLTPITLMTALPSDQMWGVLDGVYHVPGRGQSIENLISAGNYVHVVIQNAYRTDFEDWFALQLYPEDSNSGLAEDSNSL